MCCVTYMSGSTQNEVIKVLVKHIILQGFVEKIQKASFYFILADEVSSLNSEQLAVCAKYVNDNSEI